MTESITLRDAWMARSFAGEGPVDGFVRPLDAWHTALGRTLAGSRVALALDASGLASVLGELGQDRARRAPMVIRVSSACGHEPLHDAARAGAVVLTARSHQEACDLDLAARRIAERALLPVVVACDLEPDAPGVVALPSAAVARRCVGESSDRIAVVGSAQRAVFGDRRRRLPRLFDLDDRTSVGALRPARAAHAAAVAFDVFGREGLDGVVAEALDAVAAATGRKLTPVDVTGDPSAESLVVAAGAAAIAADAPSWKVASLVVLAPLPEAQLAACLGQATRVVVLERGASSGPVGAGIAAQVESVLARRSAAAVKPAGFWRRHAAWSPRVVVGRVGPVPSEPRAEDVSGFLAAVSADEVGPLPVYLGVAFRPEAESLPKRRALFDAILRDRPELSSRGWMAPRSDGSTRVGALSGRRRPDERSVGAAHVSRASYFDRVGILEALGRGGDVLPDPFLALPTIPAGTAALRPTEPVELPTIDAILCDGCGACWSLCPEAAITPAAHTARGYIDFALEAARRAGGAVDVLRPLAGRLAARFRPAADLGRAIREAGEELIARSSFDAERSEAVRTAVRAAAEASSGIALAGALPAAFGDECLALGLDPDACTGCGVCVSVCGAGAVGEAVAVGSERVAAARAAWGAFGQLPKTSAASLDRLGAALGSAARLGFRDATHRSLAPGDAAPAASGPRLALRLTLGAVEASASSARKAQLERVEELRGRVADRIRASLAEALPDADLDALTAGLDGLGSGDVPLAELAARVGDACDRGVVHAGTVRQLAEMGRQLADLSRRIQGGRDGAGRARGALLVVPGAATDWAVTEPWNPLTWPTVRGPTGLAQGLISGMEASADEDAVLLERVDAALRGPKRLPVGAGSNLIAASEPSAVPPLVVFGESSTLCGAEVAATLALLRGSAPVVVLAVEADGAVAPPSWLAAACPSVSFHAIHDLARADELADAVRLALAEGQPTFLHVVAPTPLRLECPVDRGCGPNDAVPPVEPVGDPIVAVAGPLERAQDEVAARLQDRLTELALRGLALMREDS